MRPPLVGGFQGPSGFWGAAAAPEPAYVVPPLPGLAAARRRKEVRVPACITCSLCSAREVNVLLIGREHQEKVTVAPPDGPVTLGFGRIVVSEIAVPNLFANIV